MCDGGVGVLVDLYQQERVSTDLEYHRFSCWDWSRLIKRLVSRTIVLTEQKASEIQQDGRLVVWLCRSLLPCLDPSGSPPGLALLKNFSSLTFFFLWQALKGKFHKLPKGKKNTTKFSCQVRSPWGNTSTELSCLAPILGMLKFNQRPTATCHPVATIKNITE